MSKARHLRVEFAKNYLRMQNFYLSFVQDKFHSTLICELNHANFKDSICRIKYFIGAVVFFVETCLAEISKSKLDAVIMKNAI